MSHGYLNFVLMSVLPSLWHNKVSYAIINYLEDKFIVTGREGCRVGKLSGAKSIPPRSFQKGHLKIFFGYAAGVGKTYAMLEAAHQAQNRGIDVVVGYIERHTRPDTLALLEGLEQLPEKIVEYKGISLKELDLDAALQRRPQYPAGR